MQCSGYRDVDQLRIEDESQAVKIKALSSSSSTVVEKVRPFPAVRTVDQARSAFFAHYVTDNLKTYNCLLELYASANPDKHLSASVDAVSLAYFAHSVNRPFVLDQAKVNYVHALQQINCAIQHPHVAPRDSTLLAAIFLDLFEKMTNYKPLSTGAWVSHVNGAITLIQLRGREKFQHPTSLRIVLRLCTNLLISCVASGRPVPSDLVALRAEVEEFIDKTNPKWRLMSLMVRYVDFQQLYKHNLLPDDEIVGFAESLDKEFLAITETMPPAWHHRTVRSEPTDRVYGDTFDVYDNVHITQACNVLRLTRIFINQIIQIIRSRSSKIINSASLNLPVRDIEPYDRNTNRLINRLAAEICASAPQYLHLKEITLRQSSSTKLDSLSDICSSLYPDPSQTLSCYTLLFPLYVAARSAASTTGIKEWVIGQLHFLRDIHGMRSADIVTKVLERGENIDPWTMYAMLGSYAFVA